jgi:hypothetical protein
MAEASPSPARRARARHFLFGSRSLTPPFQRPLAPHTMHRGLLAGVHVLVVDDEEDTRVHFPVRKSGDTKPFTADDLVTSVRQLADCIDRVANARQPSGQA